MGLFAVHLENLYSHDGYGVFYVCASPLPVPATKH